MLLTDLLVGLAIAVGLVGILVPVLPGSSLVLAAVLVWALVMGSPAGWVVFAVTVLLLAVGGVVKYVVPGRQLTANGIPRRTLAVGALLAVVGFFVVPVIGLVPGFVLGVYLSEVQRIGLGLAGASTWSALRAVGVSVLIELGAGLAAALTWFVGSVVV